MTTAVLKMTNVTRLHGTGIRQVRALYDASLVVHCGEMVAVMGPSGSGKTTLLTLAGALDVPHSGVVEVEGQSLAALGDRALAALRRRSIGFVFQEFNLLPALTAAENVALPLELEGRKGSVSRALALEALAEVGLSEIADEFPANLSGGQQQRVAVARAIVGERRLILADEPTGSLDSTTGEAVMQSTRARCDDGVAALVATHDARLAGWADRVLFLRDGQVDGAPEEPTPAPLGLFVDREV